MSEHVLLDAVRRVCDQANPVEDFLAQDDEHFHRTSSGLLGDTRAMRPYRLQFEVGGVGVCSSPVDIEVSAEGMAEASVIAEVIARRDYGDTVKPTGIITYFSPVRRLGRPMDPPR